MFGRTSAPIALRLPQKVTSIKPLEQEREEGKYNRAKHFKKMKKQFEEHRARKGKVLKGHEIDIHRPAIAVSDDDFEEYEEFLAWKRKHGLRATIRKMAKHQGVDDNDDQQEVRDRIAEKKTAADVSRLNRAIAKQEETARDIQ